MAGTKIIFVVLPHIHLLDLSGADQVFYEAIGHGADIELTYCSFCSEVETSTGLSIDKLKHFSEIVVKKDDYVIIPGAEVAYLISPQMRKERQLIGWLKKAYEEGANLCSICTGAFLLAETGLLDGRRCTTHWKRTSELKAKYPAIVLEENILFTLDDRIYTSAGVTAGIDLALHIVAGLVDDNFSYKIARELVVYIRRQGSDAQQSIYMSYRNHIHSGIHRVQDYLQDHLHKVGKLDDLALIACMSTRNFTRIFRKETGITVNHYITLLRKNKLKEFVRNPDMSRRQMAKLCGLRSERQVIRLLSELI